MDLQKRIEAFSELGYILKGSLEGRSDRHSGKLLSLINEQYLKNPWFTPGNVKMALKAISDKLTEDNLRTWTARYPEPDENHKPVRAGVIMAGNIPLVGFHDMLSVLISGNSLVARTSSKDPELIVEIGEILCSINKEFREAIKFTDKFLTGFDVVIATGSDNSSRYFEYYFGKYPHIIRKNRNSVAIIEGDETRVEFEKLGKDIFSYFGLGCRNISKLYIPAGYDFKKMVPSWSGFEEVINHSKYANNYDYCKAVYLVNSEKFLDTGYLLLKESASISSPVGVLYFEYYNSSAELESRLKIDNEKIQCITGKKWIPFGKSQAPELWDYSDNIDTLDFLLKINMPGIL
jgi:Acyl-CoA reductase (LuxC)